MVADVEDVINSQGQPEPQNVDIELDEVYAFSLSRE